MEMDENEDFLDNFVEFSTELVAELSLSTDPAVVDMEAAPFTLSTDGVVVDVVAVDVVAVVAVVVVERSVPFFFFSPFMFPTFFSHASLRLIFF